MKSEYEKPSYTGVGIYIQDRFYFGADCATCHKFIIVDPEIAISIRLPSDPDTRRAICPDCVKIANGHRKDKGLPPMEIREGAYIGDDALYQEFKDKNIRMINEQDYN